MFNLNEKTIKIISSMVNSLDKNLQEYLYKKYSGSLDKSFNIAINWEKFIDSTLSENDYDDFINEILSNVSIQERDKHIEILKQSLKENYDDDGYLFEIIDGKYHICIEGSVCIIYLTKENGILCVNKKLNKFNPVAKELFSRELDILSNLSHRGLDDISPRIILMDHNIIKFEKCEITLEDYIVNGNRLEIECLISILNKIDQLHKLNFLHRDLHPANIMMKNAEWFIIDFNIAHYPHRRGMISLEGHAGIKDYTDPVVYQNNLDCATEKTDIYSIGKLINFIFTKDPNNDNHLLKRVAKKCIADDEKLRYDHVYEIISDIKHSYL